MSFIQELKRRNVIRVGIAYAVGAWLLAQAADLVLDVLGAPDVILQSLVAILALGLIPALIFAWAFEITPDGIKKEKDVDRTQTITHQTARKLDIATIMLVIGAVSLLALDRLLPSAPEQLLEQASAPSDQQSRPDEVTSPADQKSIAVLPFANRSNQNDDLFFTDGIHDDLLTHLAKVGDLTVISRTSVMEYRDTSKNLKEIGSELNVGTILEGGVQRVGKRVRVTAQLIEVATDKHLWAESFDRELTAENIFELQSEIARKIVSAISIQLTPEEEQLLSEIPTKSLAAYEAYLKARKIYYGANYARSQEEEALPWLERAIALDPDYTQALAMLAGIYGQRYWRGSDTSKELLDQYRSTLDRTIALNPNSPEALRALANYHYRVENDYQKSLDLLNQALQAAPGNVDLLIDIGLSLRRLGRWDESIASFRRATELDPANLFYQLLLVETMAHKFDYQGVLDNTVPLEDADPETLDQQLSRAHAQFQLTGDLTPIQRVLETLPPVASTGYLNASTMIPWYRRDADRTIEILRNPLWKEMEDSVDYNITRQYRLANAYRLKGDQKKADEIFKQIIEKKEVIMASAIQPQAYQGMYIAISLARLGRFDAALELAAQLVRNIPEERDAMLWGSLLVDQAMVIGLAGDHEAAVDLLSRAMKLPAAFPTTAWDLYYDPNWDFLRDNPRFVELATPTSLIQTKSP